MCQNRDYFQSFKMQTCTRSLICYVKFSGFQIQTLLSLQPVQYSCEVIIGLALLPLLTLSCHTSANN